MRNNNRGVGAIGVVGAIVAVAVLGAGVWLYSNWKNESLRFDTPFQAVVLTNGSVYFGKLEGYGTKFPVLRDVYYVQSSTNPETKQTNNVLIKRGKELHAPDRMYLNQNNIVLVEPVGPNSKVSELIAASKSAGQ